MELNLNRVGLISLMLMAVLFGYVTIMSGYRPVTGRNIILANQDKTNLAVLAGGYAGLGEGWGRQVLRLGLELYTTSGVYALELPELSAASAEQPVNTSPAAVSPAAVKGDILIYCTHSTESYTPDGGEERTQGRPGLIMEVARRLGSDLEKQGFSVTVSEELHDWPDFTNSYSYSRRTVENYLKLHPDTRAVIDVHRDAFPKGGATVNQVDKEEVAPVLLVVGTDQRKPHPNWKENMALADKVNEIAQKRCPGLVRGVRPKAGVYNQDLSTRALLIEFGTDGNTLKQATNSASYMAAVLGEVLGSDQ